MPANRKSFELALLFVRLYRSMDAIVGGGRDAFAAHPRFARLMWKRA